MKQAVNLRYLDISIESLNIKLSGYCMKATLRLHRTLLLGRLLYENNSPQCVDGRSKDHE